MPKEEHGRSQIPQGTLDLIVLRTLATMGPQHAYGLALRLQQISDDLLNLNQGTLYPALLRLEQQGLIKGAWSTTENNREAKYYALTRPGEKALVSETERWNRLAGLMEKLLSSSA
jgi:transcriptional regulator